MGTRDVRLDEDVYERIKSEKRPNETFSETIDRLIGEASLLDLVGVLSNEQAAEFRRAIEESDEAGKLEIDDLCRHVDGHID